VNGSFSPDWLGRREPFDATARSGDLARRFAATLPARPMLIDLGAGSGSMFRYLAPLIGGPQSWLLVDHDIANLEDAVVRIARWAGSNGWAVTMPRRAMILHTGTGAWRVAIERRDLADRHGAVPFDEADGVVCSALLDLVSAAWIGWFVRRLRSPFLASLNVDRRRLWLPPHPLDRLVARGFQRSQTRDKGFGAALGARASDVTASALRQAGFSVSTASAEWRVRASAGSFCYALIAGEAEAALRELRGAHARIGAWQRLRFDQLRDGRLAIRIGHRDILALPREDHDHAVARRRRR